MVVPEWPPAVVGGGGFVYERIAKHYASRGHDVTVMHGDHTNRSWSAKGEEREQDGLRLVRLPLIPTPAPLNWLLSALPPIPRAIRKCVAVLCEPWDVAHLHGVGFPLIDGVAAYLHRKRIPYVFTVHGVPASPLTRSRIAAATLRAYLSLVTARTVAKASAVTCISKSLLESMELDLSQATVIPNGIDLDADALSAQPKLTVRNPLRIMSACRLSRNKGLDSAIRAVQILKQTGVDCIYDIWGADGGDEHGLRQLAQALGISDVVRFRGAFEAASRKDVFNDADISIMPSRTEAFGLAALESLAYGVPLVAARVDGLAQVLDDDCCNFVESGDPWKIAAAIKRASSRRRRRAMISAGHDRAGKFAWHSILQRYEKVVSKISATMLTMAE